MKTMQLRDAKARLSELVKAAEHGETTIVTRHGKPVARVAPLAEQSAAEGKPTFAELLLSIPHEIPFERDQTPPREVEF